MRLLDKNIIMALYRGFAGGSGDRSDRARHVRAAARGARGQRPHSRCAASWDDFWSTAAFSTFANGGEEEVYLGSADWMPRNLYERVEVMFPLKDALARERIRHEILDAYLVDNVKARILQKTATTSAPGRRRESASRRRERWHSTRRTFCSGWPKGKQALEAIPVPAPRKADESWLEGTIKPT